MKIRGMIVFLLVAMYGCGSNPTAPTPTPTPTPTPAPVTTVIATGTCTGLNVNFLCTFPTVTTTQAGNLTYTVDWTFPQDAIQVLVSAGAPCTIAQINAGQCNFIASTPAQTTPKPAVVNLHGAAAGGYVLYVGNRGPQNESVSFELTLTTGAASVSSEKNRPGALDDVRPYVSEVTPHE
jgi:hypothetical protein